MLHLYMIQTRCGLHGRLCELQKGCTPVTTVSDKAYQLLAHGRWFSPGTPVSSTNIAEILLKVSLNTKNKINQIRLYVVLYCMSSIWTRGVFRDDVYIYL